MFSKLKRLSMRKFAMSSAALFAMLLIYLIPSNPKLDIKEELEYVDSDITESSIFLLDQNSYVALTSVPISSEDIVTKAKGLLKTLTIGGMDSKIPSGFSAIIPPDTEILSLDYEDGLIKVDFSKELLTVSKDLEEKMIEAIVYTLTSIDQVDKVIIYVEGDILTKLPKTKINLPSTLDRTFGINKEFDLTSTKNITDVTVYYINQISDNYYYVPVTKYLNDDRDKISIIIDELSSGFNPNKNLKSFLNDGTELVSSSLEDGVMNLDFNSYLFDNVDEKDILEEVIYTISLSVNDNYDVDEVVFNVDNEEVYKTKAGQVP